MKKPSPELGFLFLSGGLIRLSLTIQTSIPYEMNHDYRVSSPKDALQRVLQHMIASGVKVTIGNDLYRGGRVTVKRVICSNEPPKGCTAVE
ncbi:hypothetical protein [Pseudoalteromonas sp. T1lg23B]|uniref:hypothetical protein n=1 Tax=Pseudoalteromonas sp. T1lg23B TaxID=2077097 RepID=UPI000CF72AE0|nr:hypothetical protein [Pseudoalteromonas sp. T1lg23B]